MAHEASSIVHILFAYVALAAQEGSSRDHDTVAVESCSILERDTMTFTIFDNQIVDTGLDQRKRLCELIVSKQCLLHVALVNVSIHLSTRALHCRTFL